MSNMADTDQKQANVVSNQFVVNQGRFEGPYIKILELVESHKLSISEVSLSKITDEYIDHIKSIENKNIFDMSEFVLVASTLMLIKAKSLIPKFTFNEEEEKQVDNLEKKLLLFQEIKIAMRNVEQSFDKSRSCSRERTKSDRIINFNDYELKLLSMKNLFSIALLTIAKLPNYERLRNIAVRHNIKIEHVIENILNRITESFTSLKGMATQLGSSNQREIKKNIIVSFLALLELIKTGIKNLKCLKQQYKTHKTKQT
jgi:segregation and condensation protein A